MSERQYEWPEAEKAWRWFWNYMSESMEAVLEAYERRKSPILQTWDASLDAFTKSELGDLFFDSLLEIAPNIKILFAKPKQVAAAARCAVIAGAGSDEHERR